jgi:hypothetical protein
MDGIRQDRQVGVCMHIDESWSHHQAGDVNVRAIRRLARWHYGLDAPAADDDVGWVPGSAQAVDN